jgi:hypothetical protein
MALLDRRTPTDEEVAHPALMASWSKPQNTPRTGPSCTTGQDVTVDRAGAGQEPGEPWPVSRFKPRTRSSSWER